MSNYALGIPALYILFVLTGRERHGYAIMKEVQELSEGSVPLGPATLYTTLKRLGEKGYLREMDERVAPELDDQRRRYYCLTEEGLEVIQEELARMDRMARSLKARLS